MKRWMALLLAAAAPVPSVIPDWHSVGEPD